MVRRANRFGGRPKAHKRCIILDREPFCYQRFISEIAEQDPHSHGGEIDGLMSEMMKWLRHLPGGERPGGGKQVLQEYREFQRLLPDICAGAKLTFEELIFVIHSVQDGAVTQGT